MERETSALCSQDRWVIFDSVAGEAGRTRNAPLAQLAEQLTLNHRDAEEISFALQNKLPI